MLALLSLLKNINAPTGVVGVLGSISHVIFLFPTADIVIDEEIVDAQVPGVIGFSRLSAVRTDANTMTYNLTVSVEQVGTVSGNITINVDGIIIPIAE